MIFADNGKGYRALRYFLLLVLVSLLAACGKKGALVYPDMLTPAAPSGVNASQLGSVVRLSFVLPDKDQAGRGLGNLAGVDVFRRSVMAGQDAGCSACSADYALIRKVYLNTPDSRVVRRDNQLVVLDGDVRTDRSYFYYIIPFTSAGEAGKPSLPVSLTVAEPPAPPQITVSADPTDVHLTMVDQLSAPNVVAGYNIYRAVKGDMLTIFPYNRELVRGNRFTDIGLKRGVTYVYAVRAVLKRGDGTMAESELSNLVEAKRAEE